MHSNASLSAPTKVEGEPTLTPMIDRFPGAWRGYRSDKIPPGMSIWDVAMDSWGINCSGCATSCVEKYDAECIFTPPDTPKIMIRFLCKHFPMYQGVDCPPFCSKETICPHWLIRGSINEEPKTNKPIAIMTFGKTKYYYTLVRRRRGSGDK